MSWRYSTDMSRGGDPYSTDEVEDSEELEEHFEDYDAFPEDFTEPDSGLWRWVAGVAGAVLLTAVVGTIVIVTGGDNASTAGRVAPPQNRPAVTPTPPSPSLPPETVTTLTPTTTTSPSTAEAPTSSAPPSPASEPTSPPPPRQAAAQTIIYTVSGTKQLLDPVTVTYTDETGALRTDFNVSLPWSRKLVMSGNVVVNSVTAVSFASHLNCTITDGNGQMLVSQTYNTIAATCNR